MTAATVPVAAARPPAGEGAGPARIGPNALLQLIPVLEAEGGASLREAVFTAGGVHGLPRVDGLIAEEPVARVHQALRRLRPGDAARLSAEAGARVADYIIANRIPRAVVRLLKVLPAPLAAPLLTAAITRHAWTFAGSGRFEVAPDGAFLLHDNPIVRGERAAGPLCDWHAAVFRRLFEVLVSRRTTVTETACCAAGAPACRFEIRLRPPPSA